ncbi:response regulator transcription factor [Sulfurospirillum sp. 1307]
MEDNYLEELKDLSILCVEDEDGIRDIIVKTLKYYFNSVYEARNGEEAYKLYKEKMPDIILSDIKMDKMDGIEFVKKVRKEDLNIMIIMLSAYSDSSYLIDLINLNINYYILKPLNLEKLDEALKKYINRNAHEILKLSEDLVLDVAKRELIYKKNQKIALRKREKDFLQMLYKNKNTITKYQQIEFELWSNKEMTTYALKSFIKELRAKIPENIIKNIPQEGYILE